MSWMTLLVLAIGVGVDGMTAAIAVGLTIRSRQLRTLVNTAAWFAVAHAVMPLLGWLTVGMVAHALEQISGILIFLTLTLLGAYRLRQAFRPEPVAAGSQHLVLTAMATGLDAMTVGVTMALSPSTGMLTHPSGGLLGCGVTALIAFVLCFLGVSLGSRLGKRFGRAAVCSGGVLLILLGLRALITFVI
ncbi:MAG: manganese efflux pump [Clostridia bacterium]|nr:manganese efflux pump [Clostridia bacterium]